MPMTGTRTFVWGSGGAGQLGLGNREDFATPQELCTDQLARETITTGGCHSVGRTEHGQLYAWGDNEKQQLAWPRRDVLCLTEPTRVLKLENNHVEAAACGWTHTVVVVTRSDRNHELNVLSWGANDHHQLGRKASTDEPADTPCAVNLTGLARTRHVRSLSCGWKHSLLALDDGNVFAWGSGRHGEVSLGKSQLSAQQPTVVPALRDCGIDKVFCGWQHSVFFSSQSGTVYTCGNNRHGQLAVPKSIESSRFVPAQVTRAAGEPLVVSQVAVGWHFVLCVSVAGELVSWGKGAHGQLGLGTFETAEVPTALPFSEPVASIACGSEHTLAVTQRGDLFTCGWGEHGNLGHGDTDNRSCLTKVQFFTHHDWQVVSVIAGGAVSIAHARRRSEDQVDPGFSS